MRLSSFSVLHPRRKWSGRPVAGRTCRSYGFVVNRRTRYGDLPTVEGERRGRVGTDVGTGVGSLRTDGYGSVPKRYEPRSRGHRTPVSGEVCF